MTRISILADKSEKLKKISDLTWNSTGKELAIGFYYDNHCGPCSHTAQISFFIFENINELSSTKSLKQKCIVEVGSCVRSIESHPKISTLYAASSYIGEIYLIDTSENELSSNKQVNDYIQCTSRVDSNFHKECVVSVKWIKYEGTYVKNI